MTQERVLVKHAVTGRMLVHSTDGVRYSVDKQERLTVITLYDVTPDKGEEVVLLNKELNVFRFEEPPGGPVVKHWYYIGNQPVQYDSKTGTLILTAESEIEYRPDQYWE